MSPGVAVSTSVVETQEKGTHHGHRTILCVPDIGKRSSDQDGSARSKDTREESSNNLTGNVGTFGEENEDQNETGVGGQKDFSATDKFTEGSEEQRCDGTCGVEAVEQRGR